MSSSTSVLRRGCVTRGCVGGLGRAAGRCPHEAPRVLLSRSPPAGAAELSRVLLSQLVLLVLLRPRVSHMVPRVSHMAVAQRLLFRGCCNSCNGNSGGVLHCTQRWPWRSPLAHPGGLAPGGPWPKSPWRPWSCVPRGMPLNRSACLCCHSTPRVSVCLFRVCLSVCSACVCLSAARRAAHHHVPLGEGTRRALHGRLALHRRHGRGSHPSSSQG